MKKGLPIGLYERLLDEELQELLESKPELKAILRSIDEESQPHTYSRFLLDVLEQALRNEKPDGRLVLVNRIVQLVSETDGLQYLIKRKILSKKEQLLLEVQSENRKSVRPTTPLSTSILLTGQRGDPPLEHELRAEMATADRVDILVSFIKWSGLRLLRPAFESLVGSGVRVRIISTSYMGASDPEALEWLASQPNIEVRLSYDTGGTRLHAKAYQFIRDTGFSTAYIGSANMSHAAMTSGLEWTVKVTEQDMKHVLERFSAEFASYWDSPEFEPFLKDDFSRFRTAIGRARARDGSTPVFFADITARPFQERVLEALAAARESGENRNLVVAATGTGKTVISALDYRRFAEASGGLPNLLFVAHRKEILQQAQSCFRTVLRDANFGEVLVDGQSPIEWKHVFASVQSLSASQFWQSLGDNHFKFVVIDEAHHLPAGSYRPIINNLRPELLLGLTATPERMDGSSILSDFGGRYAAEIRLPEALEERLLCPFHYFGVTDTIDLSEERFWSNGRYNSTELEAVYTGDDFRARQRLDLILKALANYQPDLTETKGIGFCAGVVHAKYMAESFRAAGIPSEVLLGDTPSDIRQQRLRDFREGTTVFLFTVDVLSEGVDIPDINLVMFLRPTESLTVFLQQLGRGLRHAPGKDCLTVLDFVGQTHRRYRLDRKFSALLTDGRMRLDKEVEQDFPSLPAGCNIQLERVARDEVLRKIRAVLDDLNSFIPETIRTWESESDQPLWFGSFIEATGLQAADVLRTKTWSEWKAVALRESRPSDADISAGRKALSRIALRTDPVLLQAISRMPYRGVETGIENARLGVALHYLLWGKKGSTVGVASVNESIGKWSANPTLVSDAAEIADWRLSRASTVMPEIQLPSGHRLRLHAEYGSAEIKSLLDLATIDASGSTGVGAFHSRENKFYVNLVTFQKEDKDFSPTTRYEDYPISRTKLHWQSQSGTSQDSQRGKGYIHFKERGYAVLFFARLKKRVGRETSPFVFLGPVSELLSYEGDRPISMVWELEYPMPAHLFEHARPA
jgi:superfamily II DNA or RNA helicase